MGFVKIGTYKFQKAKIAFVLEDQVAEEVVVQLDDTVDAQFRHVRIPFEETEAGDVDLLNEVPVVA